MNIDFKERFDNAPDWQQRRYLDLESVVKTELTDDEKIHLLWLCGYEGHAVVVFKDIFLKLQQGN